MAEPEDILEHAKDLSIARASLLEGKTHHDYRRTYTRGHRIPVRYISNHSLRKKWGFTVALEAAKRGAEVTLILGPTALKSSTPPNNKNQFMSPVQRTSVRC